MFGCFWFSVVKWFSKWGNHGGNSGVLGGLLVAGRLGQGLDKVASLTHGFVFSCTM